MADERYVYAVSGPLARRFLYVTPEQADAGIAAGYFLDGVAMLNNSAEVTKPERTLEMERAAETWYADQQPRSEADIARLEAQPAPASAAPPQPNPQPAPAPQPAPTPAPTPAPAPAPQPAPMPNPNPNP